MKLTDRQFWLNYWENKGDLINKIPKDYVLGELLDKISKGNEIKNAIELGGFPGYYSIYLKKWQNIEATLFDYVIHPKISSDLIRANGLKDTDIKSIEGDLFKVQPIEKFDLVMSAGLIEHFEDTKEILKQHLKFLNNEGHLFISLPNFQGVNGWFQKTFDIENYNKHFIECMNIDFLKQCCEDLGVKNVSVYYYGSYTIWLENIKNKTPIFRILFKLSWFIIKVFSKLSKKESKTFSPYIIIET